ncbi:hypothetical protein HG536_0B01690 [Torulaspora globosa]|uniref:Pre-mRNA-splicing factor SPF27 n=1 Tax=Torulaspora globosa TaxID=48254 RepID=A0A7G3ZCS0_9SACH|nr:uncharacterized protein HG536_0B01690 [Torulaspora globosa]QLL31306.1 hypothetical protein HG536_0B01690 [Torulaspora globosa]
MRDLGIEMDYLPFIDDESALEEYEDAVEKSIQEELRKNGEEIHPEARDMKLEELRAYPVHSLYCETSYDGDRLLQQYKRSIPRIDMERYSTDSRGDVDILCVIDSYLRHQELVLERLMPQTLLNQWAINNDFLAASSATLQKVIDDQETNIYNLNSYRKNVQLQNARVFAALEEQWKKSLIDTLNVE